MFITELEINLIERMIDNLYEDCSFIEDSIITAQDIDNIKQLLKDINSCDTRFDVCSILESLYYCFSILLSEVRQRKRNVMAEIFEQKPKISQEKSVLKEKLDAEPEYAILHKNEEQLFQFIEHIQNIKNNLIYLFEEKNEQ